MVEEPCLFVREPFVAISADLEEVIGSWCSRGTSDCFREFRYDLVDERVHRYNCLICLRVVKCEAKVVVDLSSVDLDVVSIETTEVSNKIVDD